MNRKYENNSSVASTVFSGLSPKRLFVVDYQKYLIQYFQIEYPYQLSGTWIQIQSEVVINVKIKLSIHFC